jgi:uncharacterized membrane protein
MSDFSRFNQHFFRALGKIRVIFFGLFVLLVIDAAMIAYVEEMSFANALYFTFVTGLTVGYGDIAPATHIGRILAILTALQGILITGLIVAVAVFAVKETMEHPPDNH